MHNVNNWFLFFNSILTYTLSYDKVYSNYQTHILALKYIGTFFLNSRWYLIFSLCIHASVVYLSNPILYFDLLNTNNCGPEMFPSLQQSIFHDWSTQCNADRLRIIIHTRVYYYTIQYTIHHDVFNQATCMPNDHGLELFLEHNTDAMPRHVTLLFFQKWTLFDNHDSNLFRRWDAIEITKKKPI